MKIKNFQNKILRHPYILGLWLGDKYWWSSSIGITNINLQLIKKFRDFLKDVGFEDEKIKLSIYTKTGKFNFEEVSEILQIPIENIKSYKFKKGKEPYFIVYINSRPFKRQFISTISNLEKIITEENIFRYLAGKIDADGHVDRKINRIRIRYTTEKEAKIDFNFISNLLKKEPKIKFYRKANEWILEIIGKQWIPIIKNILKFSSR